jgi:hypothetical protein
VFEKSGIQDSTAESLLIRLYFQIVEHFFFINIIYHESLSTSVYCSFASKNFNQGLSCCSCTSEGN